MAKDFWSRLQRLLHSARTAATHPRMFPCSFGGLPPPPSSPPQNRGGDTSQGGGAGDDVSVLCETDTRMRTSADVFVALHPIGPNGVFHAALGAAVQRSGPAAESTCNTLPFLACGAIAMQTIAAARIRRLFGQHCLCTLLRRVEIPIVFDTSEHFHFLACASLLLAFVGRGCLR